MDRDDFSVESNAKWLKCERTKKLDQTLISKPAVLHPTLVIFLLLYFLIGFHSTKLGALLVCNNRMQDVILIHTYIKKPVLLLDLLVQFV